MSSFHSDGAPQNARWYRLLCLLVVLCSVACSTPIKPGNTRLLPTPVVMLEERARGMKSRVSGDIDSPVPVFIVSDRALLDSPKGVDPFDVERSDNVSPNLAIAHVSIGEGMTREQIFEETYTDELKKKAFVKLDSVDIFPSLHHETPWQIGSGEHDHSDNTWIRTIRHQLDRGSSRHILLLVHGYNTQLVTSAERAAQIYHYMGRDGAIIDFDWPSQGNLFGYLKDKSSAAQSTRLFRGLIENLSRATDAERITIIAHSAGNPIVVEALKELRLQETALSPTQLQAKYRIQKVILAAPDMESVIFFNAVLDRFQEVADRTIVYSSSKDRALLASEKLFGSPRLGRSIGQLNPWEQEVLTFTREIEFVDVSMANRNQADHFGHEYFFRNPWVSSDIGLFINGVSPEKRMLTRASNGLMWEFTRDYPERVTKMGLE